MPLVIAGAVVAALLGLIAGRLVTTRMDERPLATAWPVTVRRQRDVVVPVVMAMALAAVVVRFGFAPDLPAYAYFAVVMVALAAIDAEERRLPDRLTLPSYPIGIALLAAAAPFVTGGWSRLLVAILGLVGSLLVYGLLFVVGALLFRGRTAFGLGDVKLAGVLGLYLGWLAGYAVVAGAFLGILIGGLFSVYLLIRGANRKTALPFGPCMIAGAFAAILVPAVTSVTASIYG